MFTNSTSDRSLIPEIYKKLKKLVIQNSNNPIKTWDTDLHREFSTEEPQKAEKHLKEYSTSLATKEKQIKMTLRFHLTPLKMAKIKSSSDSSC